MVDEEGANDLSAPLKRGRPRGRATCMVPCNIEPAPHIPESAKDKKRRQDRNAQAKKYATKKAALPTKIQSRAVCDTCGKSVALNQDNSMRRHKCERPREQSQPRWEHAQIEIDGPLAFYLPRAYAYSCTYPHEEHCI